MTWQRIDENTYIDDTLVTCAEYQLFIDEMREQRKYHQPDHWDSYQFPNRYAQKPILGVRHSDAVDFCKWLSDRESVEWGYRLPTQNELVTFSINVLRESFIGYWALGDYQFAWFVSGLELSSKLESDMYLALERAINHRINPPARHNLYIPIDQATIDMTDILDYARAIRRDFDLDRTLYRARNLSLDNDLNLTHAFDIISDRYPKFSMNLDLAFDHVSDRNLLRAANRNEVTDLICRSISRAVHLALDHSINSSLRNALELYIDFNIFRERIAGRSPAFEGIRLVKERIK